MRLAGALPVWFIALILAGLSGRLLAQGNAAERYLLASANVERVAHGLAPLAWDAALAESAGAHARVMALNRAISHGFSGERGLSERASAAGAHFTLISENVAEASRAEEIHLAWMNSPGHRENLLDEKVSAVGIAVVERDHQFYAVEDFAWITQALSFGEQEEAVRKLMARSGVDILGSTSDARPTCATEMGFHGLRRPGFVMRYTAASLDRLPLELTERLRSRRYREAAVGACADRSAEGFSGYRLAVLLYF